MRSDLCKVNLTNGELNNEKTEKFDKIGIFYAPHLFDRNLILGFWNMIDRADTITILESEMG